MLLRLRSGEDEAGTPKYAHSEIERRWLVNVGEAERLGPDQPIAITDRYIRGTRMRLREMRRDSQTVWKLTKKYECDDPLIRPIVTIYLTAAEFALLADLPADVLRKQRYRLPTGGVDYSLDRFEGTLGGLMLAELESADATWLRALPDPPWALRDITCEQRYQGGELAINGRPLE